MLFYNALDLNNQKNLWLPSIFQYERKVYFWTTLELYHWQTILAWKIYKKYWSLLKMKQNGSTHNVILNFFMSVLDYMRFDNPLKQAIMVIILESLSWGKTKWQRCLNHWLLNTLMVKTFMYPSHMIDWFSRIWF